MEALTVGEFRPDYIKCSIPLHPENAVALKNEWVRIFEVDREWDGNHHQCNVVSVRSEGDGKYLYIFEAWGPTCTNMRYLNVDTWMQWLERVDMRKECDINERGLDAFYQHLSEHGTGNRNIQRFNTRGRSKRGGRDAGGIGLAIGSHKSDFRVSVYKRTGEPGAVEFQVSGGKLNQSKVATLSMLKAGDKAHLQDPWYCLCSSVLVGAQVAVAKIAGLYDFEMVRILRGESNTDMLNEARLESIERQIDKLDRDGQQALVVMLQERLFGQSE